MQTLLVSKFKLDHRRELRLIQVEHETQFQVAVL